MRAWLARQERRRGLTPECSGNASLSNHEPDAVTYSFDHAFETTSPRERAVLVRERARRTVRVE